MNKLFLLLVAVFVTGCAANYTFEGTKYNSQEAFQAAVAKTYSDAVGHVTPLSEPLSNKKLLFGVPTLAALNAASSGWYQAQNGSPPSGLGKEMLENINSANYRGVKVFYEAITKRNIYREVQLVNMDTMAGSIAPATGSDVIYMVEPTRGSGQWFFASQSRGKQVFAFDRSAAGVEGKINAFIEAVQVQAAQD
jgi:hypothetical protein